MERAIRLQALLDELEERASTASLNADGAIVHTERLSRVRLERLRSETAIRLRESEIRSVESQIFALEKGMVGDFDSVEWQQEMEKRDEKSLGQLASLGKATLRPLRKNYEIARNHRLAWAKAAQDANSRQLRRAKQLLSRHRDALEEAQEALEKLNVESRELEDLVSQQTDSPEERELKQRITNRLNEIQTLAVSCLEDGQILEFNSWFARELPRLGDDYSADGAVARWKSAKLSSVRYMDLYEPEGEPTEDQDVNVVLNAFRLFWSLKNSL